MNCISRPLIRFLLSAAFVAGFSESCAGEDEENIRPPTDFPACHQLTRDGIERLEGKMGIKFDIPFPKDWDITLWQKWPIAEIPVEGGKVYATKPFVNPWDGNGTVIWMLNDDPKNEPDNALDVDLTLDDEGEFWGIVIHRSGGNRWEDAEDGESQLDRDDSAEEKGRAFFERAMKTYRQRATKAEDAAQALRWLAALEKIAVAIQALRKEQPVLSRPVDGTPAIEEPKKTKYVEPKESAAAQRATKRAMERLPGKLGTTFDITLPDASKVKELYRQPVGWIAVGDSKILVSRPIVSNAAGQLFWRTGVAPTDMSGWCSVHFNEAGELVEIYFSEGNDWTYENSNATISREATEGVDAFLKRGIETYHGRMGKASKPEQAKILLSGFQMTLEAMQAVRTWEKERVKAER